MMSQVNARTEPKPTAPYRSRVHGFDVIRLFSFFVVSYYHFTYALFHGHEDFFYVFTVRDWLFQHSLHPFERAFAFSGHTLLFLSMVLIGIAQKSFRTLLRFSLFLVTAWLLFIWSDSGFAAPVAAWDIHPLIFVGLLTIGAAERIGRPLVLALGVIGFLMTWIRFYEWPSLLHLNLYARSVVIGDCQFGVASWPILPWLGFLYFGYAVGALLREPSVRAGSKRMGSLEFGVWAALLSAALFRVGAYYRLQMYEWECQAFRQSPQDFYSDFIFVLFAMRLSLLASVDAWLSRWVPWLSRLHVSKNFFLAYALQYSLAFLIAALFGDRIRLHTQAYLWIGLSMMPAAELIATLAFKLGARRFFKGAAN